MKKINKKELNEILKLHKMWLNKEDGGIRADLSYIDLSGTRLTGAKLTDANLKHANLTGAILTDADLTYADLSYANLTGAILTGAILTEAILSIANLAGANLKYADLRYANLTGADLTCAFLIYANLSYANLTGAILTGANLGYANLTGAILFIPNLTGVNLIGTDLSCTILDEKEKIRKGIVLDKPMIGYKKCRGGLIVTLEIPIGATVLSINNYKRRTNIAKVTSIDGGEIATSYYNENFIYHVGETIEIEDFDFRYNIECSNGIHFFSTKKEAMDYRLY